MWFCRNTWVTNRVLLCCWHIWKSFSSAKSHWAVQCAALANDLQIRLFYRRLMNTGRIFQNGSLHSSSSLEDACSSAASQGNANSDRSSAEQFCSQGCATLQSIPATVSNVTNPTLPTQCSATGAACLAASSQLHFIPDRKT